MVKDSKPTLSGRLPVVQSMGISLWDPVYAVKEHISGACELVHIMNGEVVLHLSGRCFEAHAGDTLLVPDGVPHRDEFPEASDFRVLHAMFKWADFALLFPAGCNAVLTQLPQADKSRVRETALHMYEVFRQGGELARELSAGVLYNILIFLARAMKGGRDKDTSSQGGSKQRAHHIAEAKTYISDHLDKPISLSGIARHLKLSDYYLSHLFSEETGFTLSSYVTRLRMERAAALLKNPGIRVSEVAYAVGYDNPNYFGKAFRRFYGCPPGAYRNQSR